MESVIERECSALGGLFQTVIADMKNSYPVWDDFISKAGKLQSQLRTTVVTVASFLDAFQKVADLATSSRGGTRDIGSALTRMCMRHRSIEAKLRQFSLVFLDRLINPLLEQMEEWKKVANTLDKDHAKEYKKARQEIKKRSSDTQKLQKKAKKADDLGRGDIQPQLDSARQDVSDKCLLLEETEKQALRKALVEERSRFCCFVSMLKPVVEEEMSMLGEITHLQTLTDDLKTLTMDPHKLPPASEQVIVDLKGSDCTWAYQTPPSSPCTTVSRKSSMCSSLNSVNSSDSRSSGSHCHSPTSHFRYRSSALPQQGPARLSSVSSHDSGFISQDAYQSKSPSPMPPPDTQLSNSFEVFSGSLCLPGGALQESYPHLHPFSHSSSPLASPTPPMLVESRSGSSPPYCILGPGMVPSFLVPTWKDWAKPGPYDQPMVNTLRRTRDRKETTDPSMPLGTEATTPQEESQRGRSTNHTSLLKEVHEEFTRALSRELHLDIQPCSRDSLQGSSGYSTQTNTPCCSEDAIPSQVSDYDYFSVGGDQEVDDSSCTVPRTSEIIQSYRHGFQTKRPASTTGFPSPCPAIITPGVATIRRTPTSKPNLRRSSGGLGPIPIRPPMIPVKTPTVPDHLGGGFFPGGALQEGSERGPPSHSNPLSPGNNNNNSSTGPQAPRSLWDAPCHTSSDPPTPPPQPSSQGLERQALLEVLGEGEAAGEAGGDDMLVAIRRGVRLKKTTTNDRSAPRIV